MQLDLYDHPMSPCAQKVRLVLAEKGVAYTSHPVDLASKANLAPDYLALNPKGLVPTLLVDGRPVPESTVIMELLDDLVDSPALRPQDPLQRADMRVWTKHVDEALHPAVGALQWPALMLPVLAEKSRDEALALLARVPDPVRRARQTQLYEQGWQAPVVAAAVKTYRDTLTHMEEVLQRQSWLAGETFSLADIALIPYLLTLRNFGWEGFYLPEGRAVEDWFGRCRARDSYGAAIAAQLPAELQQRLARTGAEVWPHLVVHLPGASQ